MLTEITAKGGCLALGVGPTPAGLIEEPAVRILDEVGEWLGRCGEAIYATRITPDYHQGNLWFTASKDGRVRYAILALPDGEELPDAVSWSGNLPRSARVVLLNSGRKLRATVRDGVVSIRLPKGLKQEPLAFNIEL